jgi:hypothetical protein
MLAARRADLRRRLTLLLIVGGSIAVLGGGFPPCPDCPPDCLEPDSEGDRRAASIEDVDLNLFTGRLALKKVRPPSESRSFFHHRRPRRPEISPLSSDGHLRPPMCSSPLPAFASRRAGRVQLPDLPAFRPPTLAPKSRWIVERLARPTARSRSDRRGAGP